MFNVIITVTYHFSGVIRHFAIPERFNNRELVEKAMQQLAHTSYLDDGVGRIVTHTAEVVEVYYIWRLSEPKGRTPSDRRCIRGCAVYRV